MLINIQVVRTQGRTYRGERQSKVRTPARASVFRDVCERVANKFEQEE